MTAIPESMSVALDRAFVSGPLQPPAVIALVLGISTKTLHRLGDAGRIRYVVKGTTHRQYAREHVEDYLEHQQCQSISPDGKTDQPKARSTRSISSLSQRGNRGRKGSLVRRAKEQKKRRDEWKRRCANSPPLES